MIIDIHAHSFPEKIAASAVSHLQQASHSKAFSDGTEKGLSEKAMRGKVDMIAASLFLQAWLDARNAAGASRR